MSSLDLVWPGWEAKFWSAAFYVATDGHILIRYIYVQRTFTCQPASVQTCPRAVIVLQQLMWKTPWQAQTMAHLACRNVAHILSIDP